MTPPRRPPSAALGFYAWLLRLYPAEFRQAFGAQILQTFCDQYAGEVAQVDGVGLRFWLAVLGDEARAIARERLAEWEGRANMKASNWVVLLATPLLIALAGYLLVNAQALAFFKFIVPAVTFSLILLGALAVFLRAKQGPAVGERRAWLGSALTFSLVWLALAVGLELVRMLGPVTQTPGLLNPGSAILDTILLGLPALFGALGLVSAYGSGQARSGTYAGLLAGVLTWGLGTAISVGLALVFYRLAQHRTFFASDWGLDYQSNRWSGSWEFVQAELFDPDFGPWFFVMNVLYASVGGLLGTWAAGRRAGASAAKAPAASFERSPARSALTLLGLWVLAFGTMLLAVPHAVANTSAPGPMQAVLSGAAFTAWLLILLLALAAMRRATRRRITGSTGQTSLPS